MSKRSEYQIDIPRTDLLTYTLRPNHLDGRNGPLWLNADATDISVTRAQALDWGTSLATAFAHLGISKGDVVLYLSPNHIYIPVAFVSLSCFNKCCDVSGLFTTSKVTNLGQFIDRHHSLRSGVYRSKFLCHCER